MSKYINEAGSFLCQVVEPPNGSWFGESPEKKTPFIAIRAVVNDETSRQHGNEITWQGWLSEGAFDRTIKDLSEVFGFDGDLESLASGDGGFVGMECMIVVESESYNAPDGTVKETYKAKWLNAPGSGGRKAAPALEGDRLKKLIAAMGGKSKAIAKSVGAKAPAAKPEQAKSKSPW